MFFHCCFVEEVGCLRRFQHHSWAWRMSTNRHGKMLHCKYYIIPKLITTSSQIYVKSNTTAVSLFVYNYFKMFGIIFPMRRRMVNPVHWYVACRLQNDRAFSCGNLLTFVFRLSTSFDIRRHLFFVSCGLTYAYAKSFGRVSLPNKANDTSFVQCFLCRCRHNPVEFVQYVRSGTLYATIEQCLS